MKKIIFCITAVSIIGLAVFFSTLKILTIFNPGNSNRNIAIASIIVSILGVSINAVLENYNSATINATSEIIIIANYMIIIATLITIGIKVIIFAAMIGVFVANLVWERAKVYALANKLSATKVQLYFIGQYSVVSILFIFFS